ncbi:MAG: RhuM family protein [Lentisphaeria bacterium]|jgi:hypothetical protein
MQAHGEILLYEAAGGGGVEVRLERDTVWLNQRQMAELFDKDSDTIGLHLRNIYQDGELDEVATSEDSSVVRREGSRTVNRRVRVYNLDAIISVGYRVNSKRGVQFRQWATRVLREHLVRGYTVNEKRLAELKQAVRLVESVIDGHAVTGDEALALLRVVADFTRALDLLDDYDHQRVGPATGQTGAVAAISYADAIGAIAQLKEKFAASVHFGLEKDDSLRSSLATVFQTFGGKEVYPTLEAKAANLLYFLVRTIRSLMATSASPPHCSSGSWRGTALFTGQTAPNVWRTRPWWP